MDDEGKPLCGMYSLVGIHSISVAKQKMKGAVVFIACLLFLAFLLTPTHAATLTAPTTDSHLTPEQQAEVEAMGRLLASKFIAAHSHLKDNIHGGDLPNVTACEVCEFVAQYAEWMVKKQNMTTSQIIAVLNSWCGMLGPDYSVECTTLVNTVGWLIVMELQYGASPDLVCNTAMPGICISANKH